MSPSNFPWRVMIVALAIAVVLAIAQLFVVTINVLLLTFAGALFGVFLNALSRLVSVHTPLNYRPAFGIVVAVLFLATAAGVYLIGWRVAEHAAELTVQLQSDAEAFFDRVQESPVGDYVPSREEFSERVTSGGGIFPRVLTAGMWITWGITGVIVILFVGLYTAYDPDLYRAGLIKLFPLDRRADAEEVLRVLRSTLVRWMLARMMSMSVVGVLTVIGLWLLGVPMAMSLGVLAALLTFVPNIGPILAAVPQILLALEVSTNTALYVILFNFALQGVESYLVTPMIERYEVRIAPAVVIFAQLLMGVLIGIIGVVMAAPLAASVIVLVQMLYVRDKLGDNSPGELTEEAEAPTTNSKRPGKARRVGSAE